MAMPCSPHNGSALIQQSLNIERHQMNLAPILPTGCVVNMTRHCAIQPNSRLFRSWPPSSNRVGLWRMVRSSKVAQFIVSAFLPVFGIARNVHGRRIPANFVSRLFFERRAAP